MRSPINIPLTGTALVITLGLVAQASTDADQSQSDGFKRCENQIEAVEYDAVALTESQKTPKACTNVVG